MRLISKIHRWIGGVIGLLLALIGLTGVALVHRDAWIMLPHSHDTQIRTSAVIINAAQKILTQANKQPQSLVLASDSFGLHRLTYGDGSGAYFDQAGQLVVTWATQWERPEIWLTDLHKHLLTGKTGQWFLFCVALGAIISVLTGMTLWWRTRKVFSFRLLPRQLTRGGIIKHHKDLGIVAAPFLLLSLISGALIAFQPLTAAMASIGVKKSILQPDVSRAMADPMLQHFDLGDLVTRTQAMFPNAELRSFILPKAADGKVTIRVRHAWEWQPNGNTAISFAAQSGTVLAVRDAQRLPAEVRFYNLIYPVHAAKSGGLGWRLVMTLPGLALALLGSLAVWSFWIKRSKP